MGCRQVVKTQDFDSCIVGSNPTSPAIISQETFMKKGNLDIHPTFKCNSNCIFCLQGDYKKHASKFEMSTEEVKGIIKEDADNCKKLILCGGEITLRDDLPDLIKYISNFDCDIIEIQSNGNKLDSFDYCQSLLTASGNKKLQVCLSLHGDSEELQSKHSNLKNLRIIEKAIENLKSLDVTVITNTVITKLNYKRLPEIALFSISKGTSSVQFSFLRDAGYSRGEVYKKLMPRFSEVKDHLELAISIVSSMPNKYISVDGMPLCVYSKSSFLPFSTKVNRPHFEEDQVTEIKGGGLEISPNAFRDLSPCRSCKLRGDCPMVYGIYADIYGTGELNAQ